MKAITLTAKSIARLPDPADGRYEVRIAGHKGLSLLIGKNRRSWVLRHEHKGVRQVLKLRDSVPGEDLKLVARDAAAKLAEMATGTDLAAARRSERGAITVAELAQMFLSSHTARPQTLKAYRRQLHHDILPVWGNRQARIIERDDVVELLDGIVRRVVTDRDGKVVRRGAKVSANRVHSMLSKLFTWAALRSRTTGVKINPVRGLPKPGGREDGRERSLSPTEIRVLFTVGLEGQHEHVRDLYLMMMATGQRDGAECAQLPWSEIDLEAGVWRLPAARSKNHRAHELPLVGHTLEMLKRRHAARGDLQFVFGNENDTTPFHALGVIQSEVRKACGFGEHWQARDIRRTCASKLGELGASRVVIGAILNHVDKSVTARYDRHTYEPEVRRYLEKWDHVLAGIISGETAEASNVIQMRSA